MSEKATKLLEVIDGPILFGLEAQGHIPVIASMLEANESWDEIGRAIGWHGPTAQEYYQRYLKRKAISENPRLE
jgi:hypothetical protein